MADYNTSIRGKRAPLAFNPELVEALNKQAENEGEAQGGAEDFDKVVEATRKALQPVAPRVQSPARRYTLTPKESSTINELTETRRPQNAKRPKPFVIPIEMVYEIGMKYKDPELRCLFFIQYLGAARISEVLGQDEKEATENKNAVHRSRPMVKSDIVFEPGVSLTITYQTLKRRDRPERTRKFAYQGLYAKMIDEILNWVNDLPTHDSAVCIIRRTAVNGRYAVVKVEVNPQGPSEQTTYRHVTPHLIRHWRLTHLVQLHHFTDSMLKEFVAWTSALIAAHYVHHDPDFLYNATLQKVSV